MAALPEYTVGGLSWSIAANGSTDLIAAYLVDLANYADWRFTPSAVLPGSTVGTRYADGVVIDNMDGVADVYATIGLVTSKIPRFQKSVIPMARGATSVVITGAGTPRVYFYAGTFHGQTDNVSFYSVQQMAAQSTITSGSIDAYLQTLRWKFNLQLASGTNLDNLTDSGFFDVLNPNSPASGNLPAGTWSITATSFSQSNLYTYQLARNVLAPDTQLYERRQLAGSGWTPWRNIGLTVTGQCQFQYVSPAQCKLFPMGGGLLTINGNQETVPSAGVTIANTIGAATLAASTLYFCFAYMNAGVMALEWSATAFSLDARGLPIKAGDATRTCVGMCYTDANGAFQNSDFARCVGSYFNRRIQRVRATQASAQTGSTGSVLALYGLMLSWGVDACLVDVIGYTTNTAQNANNYTYPNFFGDPGPGSTVQIPTAGLSCNPACCHRAVMPVGLVTPAVNVGVSGGTGTWGITILAESLQ